MTKHSKRPWLIGAASVAMAMAAIAPAQAEDLTEQPEAQTSEDIVVLGRIQYRDRSDTVAPTLQYDSDYFQRFEPLTVGDALKRVPSVAFLSDILESDGVRLRGLDPAYTQILINGEQVPGSGDSSGAFGNGADGAFFVDRIPAELIERVEIVRSQSANRSGDAVAGALNIVLRDSYSLDGGYVRGGVLNFANDGHWGEVLGGVWGGEVAGGRLLVGLNMQDRHNPKDKVSLRYDDRSDATINDSEVQTDVRDGTDYSGNFSYTREIGPGELSLSGFFVQTDRYQNEDSVEYDNGVIADANIETVNNNDIDIDQQSYTLSAGYQFPMFGGETRARASFARFENDAFEFEDEVSYNDFLTNDIDEFESEIIQSNLTDDEFKFRLDHEREVGALNLQFGVHYEQKERDNLVQDADDDLGGPVFPSPLPANGSLVDPADLSPIDGGDNTIERTRIDPYVMIGGSSGAFQWEAGLRYETTEVTITDRTVGGPAVENSYETLLPSAHFKWNLTDDDRLLASVARTVRNPSFNFISPALLETELEDNDFIGNPDLDPETAWGFDVGYERRLGRTGVAGVNFFYRDVTDLIEVVNTTAEGSEGPGTFIYTAENAGDGTVWGVEFDFSAPLTVVGLENTGVFLNYSWLDSEIEDFLGERRFNSQAESIFNVGFIHDMRSLGASFGATYRSQGDAFSRIVSEEVSTSYGADLEMFVEKRFGERFTLRLTGSNLLDASKDEIFDKFVTEADQIARSYDEYEIETESAGPVFQLIGRYAF